VNVEVDEEYKAAAGGLFGEYMGTLRGDHVRADVFRRCGRLVAYVAGYGVVPAVAIEPYLPVLDSYADRQGMAGRLRLIFT
jgi:hypothetical protein